MKTASLLQLKDVDLAFGGTPLFTGANAIMRPNDRVALVGRNGSGKSTLMKIIAGIVEPDRGERVLQNGISVGYMEQDPDLSKFALLGDYAASGLEEGKRHMVEKMSEGLEFDPGMTVAQASGGERRRAALAKLLAESPDLMLLDEPTNHLDIRTIQWLERRLREARQAFMTISHDRSFLKGLTTSVLWIDRGVIRRLERGFEGFEEWRDAVWAEEDESKRKLERKIKSESRWAVEGISARRRRNQGRLRALGEMRERRASMVARAKIGAQALEISELSGRKVVEAIGVFKAFGDREIASKFSMKIMRGDRVAFIGPNGAGKTTLLKILTGEIKPDRGKVKLGTSLQMAVFGQNREQLDMDATLWETLTGDETMRIKGRSDQVMVRGRPRHVIGYLKEFLFEENRAKAKVGSLSGGEVARLLLCKILARDSNFLVLDEPTNDLDVETLDLLQELLADYEGTVLLVSHDRDFINRVATTTVVMEGGGKLEVHAGGWRERALPKGAGEGDGERARRKPPPAEKPPPRPRPARPGLTFTEEHRQRELLESMPELEREISALERLLSDPELYQKSPERFRKASEGLAQRRERLGKAEDEWLALEEKRAEAGKQGELT